MVCKSRLLQIQWNTLWTTSGISFSKKFNVDENDTQETSLKTKVLRSECPSHVDKTRQKEYLQIMGWIIYGYTHPLPFGPSLCRRNAHLCHALILGQSSHLTGNSKIALRTFLQHQFKSRKLQHNAMYTAIPEVSEYRSTTKPFKLRRNPYSATGEKITTNMQISHLLVQRLLYLVIFEDLQRTLEPTVGHEHTQLVRRLPIVSHAFLNPASTRLK